MSNLALILALIVCIGLLSVIMIPSLERLRFALHHMKPLTKTVFALILIVIIVILTAVLTGRRGEGSILAENKEAESTGPSDHDEEAIINECLKEAVKGNPEGDLAVYIRVSGEDIRVGEKEFTDTDELKNFLGILVRTDSQYVLVDDYASARAFESVKTVLSEVGITYTETAE